MKVEFSKILNKKRPLTSVKGLFLYYLEFTFLLALQ